MLDPIALAQSIYGIAVAIKEQVDLAKSNKAQFNTLNRRIQEIVRSIQSLNVLPRTDAYGEALNRFKETLQTICDFSARFSDKKWYQHIIRAGNHRAAFEDYTLQLKESMAQLSLGLNVQQLMNAEQDRQDQANDNQAIQSMGAELIRLQQEEKNLLLDIKMDQARRHDVLARQLGSLQVHLKQLAVDGSPKKKAGLNDQLRISFYDLEIQQVLGEGSFGTVYYGKHAGRSVAVKMISASAPEHAVEFQREVEIMSRLRSSQVVQLFGFCQEPASTCVVMEYLEQGDLYQLLAKKPFNPEEQKRLILDVAQGLHYLHSQGVIHRDLKSANVLVNTDGHAKIADFGLSKIKAISVATAHKRSEALQWMAPEVRSLNPRYSIASDVYSFGVILWEIITGASPFDARTNPNITMEALKGRLPGVIPASVPDVYQQIIKACWATDPNARPTMSDLVQKIESYVPRPASPDGEAYFEQAQRYEKDKVYDQAYKAYDRASQKGIWKANTHCALFTLQGGLGGATTNKEEARRRLTLAAEHGHQRGMYNLARMYEKGDGIAKNLEKALSWYRLATEFDEALGLTQDAKGKVDAIQMVLQATLKPGQR